MAAVTQLSTAPPNRHVLGDLVCRVFTISGASGSTLQTGMKQVLFAAAQIGTGLGVASIITIIAVNNTTSPGLLSFTTSGAAMAREVVIVFGREG